MPPHVLFTLGFFHKALGAPSVVSRNGYTNAPYYGSSSGTPTITGTAKASKTLTASIDHKPPNPTATYYHANGVPQHPVPALYVPARGLGTNGTLPRYMVNSDWASTRFSDADFEAAGLGPEVLSLIEIMAKKEVGHVTCSATWSARQRPNSASIHTAPFVNGQTLSKGSSPGTMAGLAPMRVWLENGWPQSWQWTILAPYISACPVGKTRLAWQSFPTLHILDNPNINRMNADDTEADGSEQAGNRITNPSVSNLDSDDSCINA
ncbi:hypothetical protein BDW67DRAFT_188604 [Aspergillus spinulosporus]